MTITGDLSHAPARIGERATALLGCVVGPAAYLVLVALRLG
jgi:hypothetical protein